MRVFRTEPPEWWRCDECQTTSPKITVDDQKSKKISTLLQQTTSSETMETIDDEQKTKKISTLPLQTTLAVEGQNKNCIPVKSKFKEKRVDKGRTKYLSCDEAVKLSSGSIKLNDSRTQFCNGMSKSMTPPRVLQQSTSLKENIRASTCIRTPIKSPQNERGFKPNLQQPVFQESSPIKEKARLPVVQQSFGQKEKATMSTCEMTPTKSPQQERSFKQNLKQPAVQRSFSPKAEATVCTGERTPIKSPQEERSFKPNLQQPVQKSFSPKEKATLPTCIESPKEENFAEPNLQQPSPKEKATPSLREGTRSKSREEEEETFKPNLHQPIVQPSCSAREKVVLSFRDRGNGSRSVKSSVPSRRVKETNPEREKKTSCKSDADVEAGKSNTRKSKLTKGLPVFEMRDPYIPSLTSYWKGSFYLAEGTQKFKAHLPSRVHYKVYETVMKMPESIYFEQSSNYDIRTLINPAGTDDIGLYFFPMFKKSSENDISIIDFMRRNNSVLRSHLEGLELIVFSSRVLPSHAQEFDGNCYLWGVFRRPKTAKNVTDTARLTKVVKSEPCYGDVPPGFKRICEPCKDVPPGFKRICRP